MKPLAWWNIQGPPLLNAQPRAVSEICPHRPRWSWNSESTPSCPKLTSHHDPKIKVFQARWSSVLSWELTKKSEYHPVVLGLSVACPIEPSNVISVGATRNCHQTLAEFIHSGIHLCIISLASQRCQVLLRKRAVSGASENVEYTKKCQYLNSE